MTSVVFTVNALESSTGIPVKKLSADMSTASSVGTLLIKLALFLEADFGTVIGALYLLTMMMGITKPRGRSWVGWLRLYGVNRNRLLKFMGRLGRMVVSIPGILGIETGYPSEPTLSTGSPPASTRTTGTTSLRQSSKTT